MVGKKAGSLRKPEAGDEDGDARWRALAAGTLCETEVAALREDAERSDEGRALFEACRPFTVDEREEMLGRLGARLREEQGRRRRSFVAVAAIVVIVATVAMVRWRWFCA